MLEAIVVVRVGAVNADVAEYSGTSGAVTMITEAEGLRVAATRPVWAGVTMVRAAWLRALLGVKMR